MKKQSGKKYLNTDRPIILPVVADYPPVIKLIRRKRGIKMLAMEQKILVVDDEPKIVNTSKRIWKTVSILYLQHLMGKKH